MPRDKVEQASLFGDCAQSEKNSFPQMDELPEGFLYHPSLLTAAEQCQLLDIVRTLDSRAFDFHGFQAKRRVIEFGYHYDFEERGTTAADPIPAFLLPIRGKAAKVAGIPAEELVEGIITEYPPGAPIGWHRDVPQFEIVIGISLASSCPHASEADERGEHYFDCSRTRLRVRDARTRTLAIPAQHSSGKSTALLNHVSHFAQSPVSKNRVHNC